MPDITRPDGAVIHYETFGAGPAVLLIAPGGVNSEVGMWPRGAIDPIAELASEFTLIGMDQRHAGRSWNAPPHFSYDLAWQDQLAVLDDAGVERAQVWGGCIGVGYLLRLIQEAPERITGAVGQDPVGLDHTNSPATFHRMFASTLRLAREQGPAAVVGAATKDPLFVQANGGGPFARRIAADPAFRDEIAAMSREEYVGLVEEFAWAIWPDRPPYFTVSEEWVRGCPAPLLILPGSDDFHPTSVARKICAEAPDARCLDVDCRSEEKRAATTETIRAFLRDHAA